MRVRPREVRVAPHIVQVLDQAGQLRGWRVYVKRDGVLKPKRFPPEATLEQLQAFVDAFTEESEKLRTERRAARLVHLGSFTADTLRYLRLRTVRAMVSVGDRERDIARWVTAFGSRPRSSLTTRAIDEQLQAFLDSGLSGSTVNKLRAALMSLWTRLDGKGAANPVRDAMIFPEAEEIPRGQPYALLVRILDAVPNRGRPTKGVKGSTKSGSLSKVRLELMAWTGMAPSQIARLTAAHFSLKERWYLTPRRAKGAPVRFPRPVIRKRMSADAHAAFARFAALKAHGAFDRRALRHTWFRAIAAVERTMRKELKDPEFTLPRIRLYDIRHSFAAEMYRVTKNLRAVGELLDHGSERTTRRYALTAVPGILEEATLAFEQAVGRAAGGNRPVRVPSRKPLITGAHTRRQPSPRATPAAPRMVRKYPKK